MVGGGCAVDGVSNQFAAKPAKSDERYAAGVGGLKRENDRSDAGRRFPAPHGSTTAAAPDRRGLQQARILQIVLQVPKHVWLAPFPHGPQPGRYARMWSAVTDCGAPASKSSPDCEFDRNDPIHQADWPIAQGDQDY